MTSQPCFLQSCDITLFIQYNTLIEKNKQTNNINNNTRLKVTHRQTSTHFMYISDKFVQILVPKVGILVHEI